MNQMTLADCNKGDIVKVLKLHAEGSLKQRLISFGVMKEAVLSVAELAPAKSTIIVKVANTQIALRDQEAMSVEVQKI